MKLGVEQYPKIFPFLPFFIWKLSKIGYNLYEEREQKFGKGKKMEFVTLIKIGFWIVIGVPLVLAITNLFLRIALGYWSPFFKWLLFAYLAILGAFYAAMTVYFRALERSNEIERQRSTARSMERISEQLRRNRWDHKDTSGLERTLREMRR